MDDRVASEAFVELFHGHNCHSSLPSLHYAFDIYNPYYGPHYNSYLTGEISSPSYNFNDSITQSTYGSEWNEMSNDAVLFNDVTSQPAVDLPQSLDNLKCHGGSTHTNVDSDEDNGLINALSSEPEVDHFRSHSENMHANVRNEYDILTNTCGSTFTPFENFKLYSENAHLNNEDNKLPEENKLPAHDFVCKIPNTSTSIVDCRKTSHADAEIRCDFCGRSFKKIGYLKQHINARHNIIHKDHACAKCGKRFVTEEECSQHFARHFAEKRFVCTEENCGKSFHYNTDLGRHVRLHSRKLCYCFVCGKGFARLTHLEAHRKVHLKGEKGKKIPSDGSYLKLNTVP